jgi:ATP-dependent Clp protease ATP-binding subunit ClpA
MEIVKKSLRFNEKLQPLEFVKVPEQELEQIIINFKLKDILNKEKYIPRIIDLCIKDQIFTNRFQYKETLDLYDTVIEINPQLKYETIIEGIEIDLSFLNPEEDSVNSDSKAIVPIKKAKKSKDQREYKSIIEIISNIDFKDLGMRLNEKVIGQEEAIKQILKPLINTKHRGIPKDGVPSSYMMGPSGSGKTSSIRILAEEILEVPFLHISGSEYIEQHTASKLFGAPPGYLGYDVRGGRLTDFVQNYPESIILFDEIDKVHPKIYGALTSFLGDKFVTINSEPKKESKENPKKEPEENLNKKCYFKGYMFFTSNTGNKASEQGIGRAVGFGADSGMSINDLEKKRIMSILRNQGISEAFLGRINNFVRFNELEDSSLYQILDNDIEEANEQLKYYQIKLSKKAKDKLISLGEPTKWGARNIYNNLDKFIVSALNYEFEMGESITEGSEIFVDFKNNEFTYSADKEIFFRKNSEYL